MYVKKTYRYADIVEVHKYHTSRYGDHSKRGKKSKETSERKKELNARRRKEHVCRILCANFNEGDSHVILTYKEVPEDEKKEISKFLRVLRREAKKTGTELKYIYVTEKGKRGRVHHHIVMNITDASMIRHAWNAGTVKISPLYPDRDYEKLAEYLLKAQEEGKKRYHGSKNLEIPRPEIEIIKAGTWKKEPVPEKGYWIKKDTIVNDTTFEGYPYQRYKMIRIDEGINRRKNKNRIAGGRIPWEENP